MQYMRKKCIQMSPLHTKFVQPQKYGQRCQDKNKLYQNTERKRFIEHSGISPVNSYNEVKMNSLYYLYWLHRCGVAQSHIQETFSGVRSWL